jgi:hypothetical protein
VPVYKQPRSPYWLIELHIGGRRFRRSSKTTSKRKAQALEWEWRNELTTPAAPEQAQPPMALGEALDRYVQTVIQPRNRPKNAVRDKYLLDRIRRDLGEGTLLPAIAAAQIASFSQHLLREGKAPATVNRHLAVLSAVLRRPRETGEDLLKCPRSRSSSCVTSVIAG